MALSPGARVGQYEILRPLGAGGMGEVYRARDTRLAREVALKVLPDIFAGDAERLARFQREARTLAALNHPHIAQLHGFEDDGTMCALVMGLIEGEELAERIRRGPMPLAEALDIARQIAAALGAAHEHDPERAVLHLHGEPAPVVERVGSSGSFAFFSAVGGVLAYRTGPAVATATGQLTWFESRGQSAGDDWRAFGVLDTARRPRPRPRRRESGHRRRANTRRGSPGCSNSSEASGHDSRFWTCRTIFRSGRPTAHESRSRRIGQGGPTCM